MGSKIEHKDIVELLLQYNADPNIKDINGDTALHCAAHYGNKNIVKLLFAYGANSNIQNNDEI